MRRLSVRMALAMLGTMAITLLVIAGTQRWAEWRRFQALPEEVRASVPHPGPWKLFSIFAGGPGPGPQQAQEGRTPALTPDPDGPSTFNDRLALSYRSFNRYQDEAFLVGVGIAALASLALALWLSRLVARPVERVSRATTLLARGDLSARVPLTQAHRFSSLETARLTENFNRMAQALEGYENERKAMIADIAHELRTPLTAMSLRLQALQDGLVPLDAAEIASLSRNADLLGRLVEDLRVLSLADAGRLELRRRPVDLVALAAAVLDDYQTRLASQGVVGGLEADEAPVIAEVDPDRMTQVLGNLLDNALRVTGGGGRVTVAVRKEAGSAHLSVSDTGPGLSPAAAARAFDRYYQDKDVNYEKPVLGASGLGLAIVRTLVTLHGGDVSARNRPQGSGAVFEVTLPAA